MRLHQTCTVSAAACCMLCLLCHHTAPCSAQLESTQGVQHTDEPGIQADDASWPGNRQVLALLLKQYGDGKSISLKGFEMLLKDLKLTVPDKLGDRQKLVTASNVSHNHSEKEQPHEQVCESITSMRERAKPMSADVVLNLCPALIMGLVSPSQCLHSEHGHDHHHATLQPSTNQFIVWMYATGSIIVISACGLLAVAVIPIMQRMFYQQMLQFLVSLAVGSLCGDALLHLLPHAMSGGHSTSHSATDPHENTDHDVNLWRGLVALTCIVSFFFVEKCLTLAGEWRRRSQQKKKQQPPAKVRVMRDAEQLQGSSTVGEKLCKHKYSSYPYCYAEIKVAEEGEKKVAASPSAAASEAPAEATPVALVASPETTPVANHKQEDPELAEAADAEGDGYTVILREHARTHHGHSHSHGHVHSAPHTLSAVAWMVVMGDGIHNMADGLAIGAAFAAGIPGGISTAVAVFCHELPHELGDFAVLIKAGMSCKQAVCYNLLSSALCFVGMLLGVLLGHSEAVAQWVFAAAAGMFLYIALVDMIPELTSGHSENATVSSWLQTMLLQVTGMFTGLGIMLLIALYEDRLHSLFCD